jgi:hypothetical protein
MTALQQNSADLVDQGRSLAEQSVAHPMQGLHVELVCTFEFDEAHGRPCGGLSNGFGIAVVVLLRLDVGRTDILRRHQAHRVALGLQQAAEMVCTAAGLYNPSSTFARRC